MKLRVISLVAVALLSTYGADRDDDLHRGGTTVTY